jgi:signal transduction histidine kinase
VRLADFITTNTESILEEWVSFAAASGPAGKAMNLAALRDHALEMLRAIVVDLRTPQTAAEQKEKSKGTEDSGPEAPDTAAEVHGAGRAASGFSLGEMVSEYRALRASVIRLWTRTNGTLAGEDLEDLMRFNEAIDQSTAESINRFMQDLDRSKELFLAILGHDLRSPLGAVLMSSEFMLQTGELVEPHLSLTTRIVSSAKRMNRMVEDLLDFTRSRLGAGLPIERSAMDVGRATIDAVAEMASAQPASVLRVETKGDLRGEWDPGRLSQLLANLIGNAVQYGTPQAPIGVTAEGNADEVVLRVHNSGPAIPAAELPRLFDPLKRLAAGTTPTGHSSNLGLGLYIAERIVTAHGGRISVDSSSEAGTTFTVSLPRRAPSPRTSPS